MPLNYMKMSKKYFQYASPESVGISSAAIERLIDTMCEHIRDADVIVDCIFGTGFNY